MGQKHRESNIVNKEPVDSSPKEMRFPNGIKPFESIPHCENTNDINYFAILGVSVYSSTIEIKTAHKNLSWFYHPDRRDRVFKNYTKPDGFDEECDKIFNLVSDAKNVLLDERNRSNYVLRNWPTKVVTDKSIIYQNSREQALSTIENMRVSAGLIEEEEKNKGSSGLVIVEAYYGAIENIVDVNKSIEDISYGRVLDVKIPILCMIDNSTIIQKKNGPMSERSISLLPGFFDPCMGDTKRLYVRYIFNNNLHIMNVGEFDNFAMPMRVHVVMRNINESRIKVVDEEKKNHEKTLSSLNDIIQSGPKPVFRFRYVVFIAGMMIGCKLVYDHNDNFRHWCQRVVLSHKYGNFVDDIKNYWYNLLFAEESTVRTWWNNASFKIRSLFRRDLPVPLISYVCLFDYNMFFGVVLNHYLLLIVQ